MKQFCVVTDSKLLIEICRKKLIWTLYNCQKTTYYLVRHMRGTASELGLSHMLIIALRNSTVCFGVFMRGFPQTEPAWLSRPVWLIGLLRSSYTGNIFVQPSSQQCCIASWDCLLHVLPLLRITNFHVAKSRSNKFVAQKSVNMCKKQSQLATQQCCAKSFTKMLLILLGLKRLMSQTGLVSHLSPVRWDPGKAMLGSQVAR